MNPLPYVFVILLDDIGNDRYPTSISSYSEDPVTMPWLEQMASTGALFTDFYVMPSCSPTRASLLRGVVPVRHGVGIAYAEPPPVSWIMPDSSESLLKVAGRAGLETVVIGKWHLHQTNPGHPFQEGADWHSTTLFNLNSFYDFSYWRNQHYSRANSYATTWLTSEAAIALGDSPQLVVLSPHAAHRPFHAPPEHLHSEEGLGPSSSREAKWRASCEALDASLGAFFWSLDASVRENSWWFIFGDNGTPRPVTRAPPGQWKGTVGEGGIRNTLVVWRHGLDAGTRQGLVSVCDIYATVGDILGLSGNTPRDSESFYASLCDPNNPTDREWVLSTRHEPIGPFEESLEWYAALMDAGGLKLVRQREPGVGQTVDILYDLNFAPPGEDGVARNKDGPRYHDDYVRLSGIMDEELAAR